MFFDGNTSLYELWKKMINVNCELSGDSFHESGVWNIICSDVVDDNCLGCLGVWDRERDRSIISGAMTAWVGRSEMRSIVKIFEENIVLEQPYRRTALIPLDCASGIKDLVQ